jgi:MazG family protein
VKHSQAESTPPARPADASLDRALALVEYLRAHCPWDAAQTPDSLLRHLVEESWEVADAVLRRDEPELADELGDLLLNVAFQVVLAEERGAFSRADVVAGLIEKMERRHPHLFGLGEAEPWERIKAREQAARRTAAGADAGGVLDGVPTGLEPLARAQRIQEQVATVGFDWPDAGGALEKVREEVEEVRAELAAGRSDALEDELGDLLFAAVNVARLAGADASVALARANAKFALRFRALEALAHERGVELGAAGLDELDQLWNEAKRGTNRDGGVGRST